MVEELVKITTFPLGGSEMLQVYWAQTLLDVTLELTSFFPLSICLIFQFTEYRFTEKCFSFESIKQTSRSFGEHRIYMESCQSKVLEIKTANWRPWLLSTSQLQHAFLDNWWMVATLLNIRSGKFSKEDYGVNSFDIIWWPDPPSFLCVLVVWEAC